MDARVHEVTVLPAQPVPEHTARDGHVRPSDAVRCMPFRDAQDFCGLLIRVEQRPKRALTP